MALLITFALGLAVFMILDLLVTFLICAFVSAGSGKTDRMIEDAKRAYEKRLKAKQ